MTILAFLITGGFAPEGVGWAAVGLGFIPSVVNDYEVLPPEFVLVPEAATFLTYAFLHADALHLAGNMMFLWVFGDNIEDAMGHVRYLGFYLACAAAAAFVHLLANPDSPAPLIGASGAVAGVVGAYLILHPRVKLWVLAFGRIPLRLSALWVLGTWSAFQVFNVVAAVEGEAVAWWAHLGGLAAGAALIVVLRRPGVRLFDRPVIRPPRGI